MITSLPSSQRRRMDLLNATKNVLTMRKTLDTYHDTAIKALESFRMDRRIDKKDLAALLKISPQHMCDIIARRRGLSEPVLLRILGILEGNEV